MGRAGGLPPIIGRMAVLVGLLIGGAGIVALFLWGTRGEAEGVRRVGGFDAITGTGGGGFMDPQRGIIGPDQADIERFGGDGDE